MKGGTRDWIATGLAAVAIAGVPALAIAAETIVYRYDALGRLVEVTRNASGSGNNVTTNYSYDKADNRTAKTTTGSPNGGPP